MPEIRGNEKNLVPQVKIAYEKLEATSRFELENDGFANHCENPSISCNLTSCAASKLPLSCRLAVPHDGLVETSLPPDLTGIIASRSFIPESLQEAIKAILAPYRIGILEQGGP